MDFLMKLIGTPGARIMLFLGNPVTKIFIKAIILIIELTYTELKGHEKMVKVTEYVLVALHVDSYVDAADVLDMIENAVQKCFNELRKQGRV